MATYQRTTLGERELIQRKLRLSARTRTLLLLLESDDLKQLSADAFTKIANIENYQTLLDLNLIEITQDHSMLIKEELSNQTEIITIPTQIKQSVAHIQPQDTLDNTLKPLSFLEIKDLMQQTLRQYCGLMAKNLINAIEQSNSIIEIRQHQGKWLTTLFETRIPRQQLNETLRIINHSMDKIELNHQSA